MPHLLLLAPLLLSVNSSIFLVNLPPLHAEDEEMCIKIPPAPLSSATHKLFATLLSPVCRPSLSSSPLRMIIGRCGGTWFLVRWCVWLKIQQQNWEKNARATKLVENFFMRQVIRKTKRRNTNVWMKKLKKNAVTKCFSKQKKNPRILPLHLYLRAEYFPSPLSLSVQTEQFLFRCGTEWMQKQNVGLTTHPLPLSPVI